MIFPNSASSAAALVFYLPGVCTNIDTEGKQRKARQTQYLMNTLYVFCTRFFFAQPIAAECWRGRGGNLLRILEKSTLFNEHPVVLWDLVENVVKAL